MRFPHVCVCVLKLAGSAHGISIPCRRRKNAKVLVLLRVRRNLQRGKSFRIHSIRIELMCKLLATKVPTLSVEQEKLIALDKSMGERDR